MTVWDVASRRPRSKVALAAARYHSLSGAALSPDGGRLATRALETGKSDYAVVVWSLSTGRVVAASRSRHQKDVVALAFSPDGQVLASASWDNTVKLWDAATGQALRTLTGHGEDLGAVAFSADGKTLATGGSQTVRLWAADTGATRSTFRLSGRTASLAFSSNGELLAAGQEYSVSVWDVASGRKRWELSQGWARCVALSSRGNLLASGSSSTVYVREVETGRELVALTGHTADVVRVAFSADAGRLHSVDEGGTLKTWDLSATRVVRR